jgi:hypothetical protein
MSSQTEFDLVIGIAVLALLIYRQMISRPVRGNQRVSLILLVIGLVVSVQYLQKIHAGSAAIAALAGSLVLAAVFGVVRAATIKIWVQNGQAWMKGNYVTAALWVLALAAHLGYDYLIGKHKGLGSLGDSTIVLYLAVSLAVQRVVVTLRAHRLDPSSVSGFGFGGPGSGGGLGSGNLGR